MVSWRRTLLKVPVENLRSATEEEIIGHTMVREHLEQHLQEVSGQASKNRGFLDLTDSQPPVIPLLNQVTQ